MNFSAINGKFSGSKSLERAAEERQLRGGGLHPHIDINIDNRRRLIHVHRASGHGNQQLGREAHPLYPNTDQLFSLAKGHHPLTAEERHVTKPPMNPWLEHLVRPLID